MNVEPTTIIALIGAAVTMLTSTVVLAWRTKGITDLPEAVESQRKLLEGDPKSTDPLLNRGLLGAFRDFLGTRTPGEPLPETNYRQLVEATRVLVRNEKLLHRGLGVKGSGEQQVVEGIEAFRRSLEPHAEARRAVIERWSPQPEEDPFPTDRDRRRRDPREEADDEERPSWAGRDPDGTGPGRGRRRP